MSCHDLLQCFGTLLPNINAGFPPFSSDLTDSGPSWLFRGLLPVDSVGGNVDTLGKLCLSFGFFNVLQDIAIGIVKAYDAEDALHLFLKVWKSGIEISFSSVFASPLSFRACQATPLHCSVLYVHALKENRSGMESMLSYELRSVKCSL